MVPAMRMFEKQSSELYTSNLVHEELKDRWPSDAAHEMQCTSWACLEHAEQAAQTETAIGDGAKKDRALKKKDKGNGDAEWDCPCGCLRTWSLRQKCCECWTAREDGKTSFFQHFLQKAEKQELAGSVDVQM